MIKRPLPSGSGALLVLVVLIGINLRPFLTAIGPLAGEIDAQLALGMDRLAWVTLLPLLLIGVGVLLTPALIDKTGPRPLLGAALLLGACTVIPTGPSVMVLPGTGQQTPVRSEPHAFQRIQNRVGGQRRKWCRTQVCGHYAQAPVVKFVS